MLSEIHVDGKNCQIEDFAVYIVCANFVLYMNKSVTCKTMCHSLDKLWIMNYIDIKVLTNGYYYVLAYLFQTKQV